MPQWPRAKRLRSAAESERCNSGQYMNYRQGVRGQTNAGHWNQYTVLNYADAPRQAQSAAYVIQIYL